MIDRRVVIGAGATLLAAPAFGSGTPTALYGLIGKMRAVPGGRDALIGILLEGTGEMPGCLSYVVARDPADPDVIWITEVWTDAAAHQASLRLPAVRAAITKGRPLIANFESSVVVEPVGGHGLVPCAG